MKRISYNLDNVGGVATILAIPIDYFNRVRSIESVDNRYVSVSSDKFVISVPVIDNSKFSYDEDQQTEDGGKLFSINIKGEIPRHDSSPSVIRNLEYGKWIVVCMDRNGSVRCAGTKLVPMDFKSDKTMGADNSANGIAFTFSCNQERSSELVHQDIIIE